MKPKLLITPLPCPVCKKPMLIKPLGRDSYQECDFHGVWLWASILAHFNAGKEILNEIFNSRRNPIKSHDKPLFCPRCLSQMHTTTYAKVQNLILDQCYKCNGIWFDVGELNRIKNKGDLESKFSSEVSERTDLPEDLKNQKWGQYSDDALTQIEYSPSMILGLPIEEEKNAVANWPLMTVILIIVSLLFTSRGLNSDDFFSRFMFSPAEPFRNFGITLISAAFLHGSWFHFFSNIYFFYLCSDNIEELEGSQFLLILFLSSVLGGHIAYMIWTNDYRPTIGASGGLMGILTYYVYNFPQNRFRMGFFSYFYGFTAYSISAPLFFVAYVALQIVGYLSSLISADSTNYLAHFGGAVVGLLFAEFMSYKKK